MSLSPDADLTIPEETARVAHAAFPKASIYMRMRDELGPIHADHDFAALFPKRGQPAESPARLALVTIMQFAEGLSDRQAADAVRSRIDWVRRSKLGVRRQLHRVERGVFDSATGQNVAGPPPRPLNRITIEVRDNAVFAVGKEGG